MNQPHYPPAGEVPSAIARALRGGHPSVASLFDLDANAPGVTLKLHTSDPDPAVILTGSGVEHYTGDPIPGESFLTGPGVTGHQHPESSREAGETDKGSTREAILRAIRAAGPDGMTSHELVAAGVVQNVNIAGCRLGELRGVADRYPTYIVHVVDADGRRLRRRSAANGGRAADVHIDVNATPPDGYQRVFPQHVRKMLGLDVVSPTTEVAPAMTPDEGSVWIDLIREAWDIIGILHTTAHQATKARLDERLDRWHRIATDDARQIIPPSLDWWF